MKHTIKALAAEALGYFERGQRRVAGGGDVPYWKTTDDAPGWITDTDDGLIFNAHGRGEMLPDDWRYSAIVAILEKLIEVGAETADSFDHPDELIDDMVNIYTSDLCDWLASHPLRAGYCDEAVADLGAPEPFNLITVLQMGQRTEYHQIAESVIDCLTARIAWLADTGDR